MATQQRNIATAQTEEARRQRDKASREEKDADEQRKIALTQKGIATEQRDEAIRQRDLAMARSLTAESERQRTNPQQWELSMLLAIESMHKSPTADNYEVLARLSREGARTVATFPGQYIAAFSRDSHWVVTQVNQSLVVREARGGKLLTEIPADQMGMAFSTFCFTPGARQVLAHTHEQAMLFDISGKRSVPLPVDSQQGDSVEVSSDCAFLAVASHERCTLVDLQEHTIAGSFACPSKIRYLMPSTDGDSVAYAEDRRATITSAKSEKVVGAWTADQDITKLDFLVGDTTRLAVSVRGKGRVYLDAVTGQNISESPADGLLTRAADQSVAFHDDGHELVIWDVLRGVWTKRISLPIATTNAAWSEDGEFLAYGSGDNDGSARVLQAASFRQLARFAVPVNVSSLTPVNQAEQVRVSLSPAGDLASASGPRSTSVFETHRDRPIVALPLNTGPGAVSLSGDVKRVAFHTIEGKVAVVAAPSGRMLSEVNCPPQQRAARIKCGWHSFDGALRWSDIDL